MLQVGDLVRYRRAAYTLGKPQSDAAVVLWVNSAGGTVKAVNRRGAIVWLVTSDCEVVSASR